MLLKMNKIELCDHKSCTQCYACVNNCAKGAISMVDSHDGFKIPSINYDICVGCGVCVNSCHRLNGEVNYHEPFKTLACWTKNIRDRENSSSGGAFSVLARKVLELDGIVYGAYMDENLKVQHIGIEKKSDIKLLQGSKYLQSYLGDVYKQVRNQLQNNRSVLFSGTPCQVAGLLSFLKKKYENLITCDLVCHGVPSQEAFDIYIDKIKIREKSKYFNFRYTKGWGMQLSRQTVHPSNGRSRLRILSPKNSYFFRAFEKGFMFSEACYTCHYACPKRVADFTLADFWGIGKMEPFNHPKYKGISLLLVNTPKADALLNDCDQLFFEERPFQEALDGNYNLSHTSERPQGRDDYFEDSRKMSVSSLCRKYGISGSLRDYLRLLKQSINSFR